MKVYEMLPTKKTFYLMPESGEDSDTRLTVDICYDTQQVIVKGHLNPIIIDVKTKFFVDPIITLLSYDKNAILHHMGINKIHEVLHQQLKNTKFQLLHHYFFLQT